MKLTASIMLLFCLQVSAKVSSQSVTLAVKNATLPEVFEQVIIQTGISIVYDNSIMIGTKPVTLNVKDAEIKEFLRLCLENQPLRYSYQGKTVTIMSTGGSNPQLSENDFRPSLSPSLTAPPVTGIVRGADGQPLAGVNIVVKGTKRGTVSGADGTFSIEAKGGEIIILSSIGYADRQITIGNNNTVGEINLSVSESKLDEVQIIAYGETSRRLSTATIGTIKSADIRKQPVNDPLLAIQGRVPGIIVTPTSGNFGSKVNVQIRGQNSLYFHSNPLFIVDDVPIDNENFRLNNIIGSGNLSPFSYLNPNDIASINILKDADATAIYGSRGANGVILITTKKGIAGRTTINVNSQIGAAEVAKKLKLLNTAQYLKMRKEAYANDGLDYLIGGITSANSDLRLYDSSSYTDWQEIMIGGRARYQDYQMDVSGGTNSLRFIVGGNFHRETTVYPGSNLNKKSNMHFNISSNSRNNNFKIVFTGNYLVDNMVTGRFDYTPNIFFAPNAPPLLNDDGTVNWAINPSNGGSTWLYNGNPYANNLARNNSKINNLISTLNVSYQVIKNLTLKVVGGVNRLSGSSVYTLPANAAQPLVRNNLSLVSQVRQSGFSNNLAESWSLEPQVAYKLMKGRSTVNILVGSSLQSISGQADNLYLRGFTSDGLLLNRAAASTVEIKENTSSQYKYAAIFARLTYMWDDKYIINVNGRRDGSSRFGPGYQFGNFGSIGTAWIFTREKYLHDHFGFLSFGKAKFSFGITGNDGIPDYSYLESYSLGQTSVAYQNNLGYISNGAVNQNFHWENVNKMEFGLELGFLKDKLLFQANYFKNRSSSQLIRYPIPGLAGYGELYVNLPAKLQNTGFELSINSTIIQTEIFSWTSSMNFTLNRNKLIDYPSIDESAYYLNEIGQPFYGYVNVYEFAGVNNITGDYQFYDKNRNLSSTPVDEGPPYYGQNSRVITYPKFYGGLANTFTYKNWSLDAFFQFTKQNGINPLYSATASFNTPGNSRLNILEDVYNTRWQPGKSAAEVQKLTTTFNSFSQLGFVRGSDAGYTDASFIRLKNVSFSYTIPERIINRFKIQNCRLYFQGQNLFTFTRYRGLDPETQSMSSLPPLRVWTMGLQLGL